MYWVSLLIISSLLDTSVQASLDAAFPDVSDPCANAATQRHMGDIAYFTPVEELTRPEEGRHEDEEDGDSSQRSKRAATSFSSQLWQGGIVHYSFSNQFNVQKQMKVIDGMRHWEKHTCLRFQRRTNQTNYINFFQGSGCCSYIGLLGYGEQGVSLSDPCLVFRVVIHEIGHLIGFWHEHTRPDRDNYIDVLYDNIRPGFEDNFHEISPLITDDLGVGYDYNSIMHYNRGSFRRYNGLDTLRAKASGIPLGQAVELSPLDIQQTNLLYSCKGASPPSSTLPDPLPPPAEAALPFPCGAIFSGPAGSFNHSTNQTHLDCAWRVKLEGDFIITIDLRNVYFGTSNGCSSGRIEVYQGIDGRGRIIARLCRNYNRYRSLRIYGRVFMKFHLNNNDSDPTEQARGFVASYRASDVNECARYTRCSHLCRNTYGGYECHCNDGFYLSADGSTCFDMNECALHNGGCSEDCTNTGGSYYCSCHTTGYVLQRDLVTCRFPGSTCSENNGGCWHQCMETSTSRVCSCNHGYQLQQDGLTCFDINECRTSEHGCQWHCNNTPGKYHCLCRPGYHLNPDNRTCAPDRVCAVNNGECNQKCQVLGDGAASCYCVRGFQLGEDGKTCEDINECAERRGRCQHTCINTNGSYVCDCREGYMLDSNRRNCMNINECQQQTSECQFSDYCDDTYGSYTCRCPIGYILAPDLHNCLDLDECEYGYKYICSHDCQNLPGSYVCTCREGYVLQSEWYCMELDECLTSNHRCNHSSRATCRNTEGSYLCLCPSGFKIDETGWSCVDVDECSEDPHLCGPRLQCVNSIGHYICTAAPITTTSMMPSLSVSSPSLPTPVTSLPTPTTNIDPDQTDTTTDQIAAPTYPSTITRASTLSIAMPYTGTAMSSTDSPTQAIATQFDSTTKFRPDLTSEVQFEFTTEARPDSTSESLPDSTIETGSDSITEAQLDSTTEAQLDSTTQLQLDSTTQLQLDSTTEAQLDSTTEAQLDSTTQLQLDSTTEAQLDSTTQLQLDSTTEAQLDSTPTKIQLDSTTEARLNSTTQLQLDSTTEAQLDSTTQLQLDSTTEAQLDSTTQLQLDSTTEAQTSSETRTIATETISESPTTSTHTITSLTSTISLSSTTSLPTSTYQCGGRVPVKETGVISSQNWPETYPNNMNCGWTVRTPASNQILEFSFNTSIYGIAGSMPACRRDWVKIYSYGENRTWGPFCGFTPPSVLSTMTDEALVMFHAGPRHGSAKKGFDLSYKIWDVCIPQPPPLSVEGTFLCNALVRPGQKFGPPDFPGLITSRTPQQCVWILYGGVRATLKFMYFDIPKNDGCRNGNVKFYNHLYRSNRTLIKTLCGALGTEARTVSITSLYFSIELNLGSNYESYRGFHAVMENN